MVPSPTEVPSVPDAVNGHGKVYVIDGLLDLTLGSQELGTFDLRFAACECLKAYFSNHAEVRAHFLGRAIDGYQSDRDEYTNVLTVLLNPTAVLSASDPYRLWFAAVITFHLLYENATTKAKASALTEGDSSSGEEVVTSIQTVTAHLIAGIRRDDDSRVLIGYLMLLMGWLFEDLDAVNDFLNEGSNVQSLIQAVLQPTVSGGVIVQGLCAMVLGIVYEFSTKDSPIPRNTLHSILSSRLDRDRYLDRLGKLRSHPALRDFEVTPQNLGSAEPGLLPEVYFDTAFVEFVKDNYSRISRAIDRDPGMEVSVFTNGVQKGVSRELVDSLRSQVEEKDRALEDAKVAVASLERQLGQEQADHRRSKEGAAIEVSKARDAVSGELAKAKAEIEGQKRANEAEIRFVISVSQQGLVLTTVEANCKASRSLRRPSTSDASSNCKVKRQPRRRSTRNRSKNSKGKPQPRRLNSKNNWHKLVRRLSMKQSVSSAVPRLRWLISKPRSAVWRLI
jgi:hypothetical protein